jgi:hypothetical protein
MYAEVKNMKRQLLVLLLAFIAAVGFSGAAAATSCGDWGCNGGAVWGHHKDRHNTVIIVIKKRHRHHRHHAVFRHRFFFRDNFFFFRGNFRDNFRNDFRFR